MAAKGENGTKEQRRQIARALVRTYGSFLGASFELTLVLTEGTVNA